MKYSPLPIASLPIATVYRVAYLARLAQESPGCVGASTVPEPLRASVEEVLAVVERATGLTRERLASGVKDRGMVAARSCRRS